MFKLFNLFGIKYLVQGVNKIRNR